jgi:hypothetical protein
MNASKGYYSLIQYCPDLGRLEAANVGVLLFCPERFFLKALTSGSNARIRRFFRSEGHDWAQIDAIKKGLEDRLQVEHTDIQTLDDLENFIALRANLLQITPPRPMKVVDPEKDLQKLFEELVGGLPRAAPRKHLRTYLAEKFTKAGLNEKIRRDIRVKVPVLEKEMEIPFGYQNGRFNLITPVRFEAANPESTVATACKYAIEGHELYEHPHPDLGDLQLVVFGKFRAADSESRQRVRRVFDEYAVKLFRTEELPQLIDEIRRTGKVLAPPGGSD